MFCPSCKDEFRPGFTRCASCDVDLVEDLDAVASAPEPVPQPQFGGPPQMRDYCGFLELDDARSARDRLTVEGLRCEIAIRAAPDSPPEGPVVEEFWLRVDAPALAKAVQILGIDEVEEQDGPAPFTCDACGKGVTEDDEKCPHCGASFDG